MLKSSKKTRIELLFPSVFENQQWNMLINASTVEEPLRDPNCFGSSLDLMAFIIHWERKDSRTFDKVAVRDMGRRSTRISLTGHVLGTGMTFASFHWYGTHACLMEALKIIDTGSASSNEKVLRNQFGKESGPGDLLDLTALSRGSTSAAEMKYDIEGLSIGCLSRGVRGGIISEGATKEDREQKATQWTQPPAPAGARRRKTDAK